MPWTEVTRPNYDLRSQRYASDSTDAEWALVVPFMPPVSKVGRPRKTDLRAVWDAIQYMAATGKMAPSHQSRLNASPTNATINMPWSQPQPLRKEKPVSELDTDPTR